MNKWHCYRSSLRVGRTEIRCNTPLLRSVSKGSSAVQQFQATLGSEQHSPKEVSVSEKKIITIKVSRHMRASHGHGL